MSFKSKRGDRLPPFVPLPWQMLNSKAFIELPPSASKALPYFFGKVKLSFRDPQRYFAEFSFSYTEGKRYGFALATFSKVIQALVRFGFIDPVDKGGLRGECKSFNRFKLSKRWETYGTENFLPSEWKTFLPRAM
jgi:hypothetical protein